MQAMAAMIPMAIRILLCCMEVICATCACHQFDWDAEDFICGNVESVHFGAWTASGDTCPAWKEKKRREQKKDR